jgi:PAS domain-containing protein
MKGVIWTTEDVTDRMAVDSNRKQEDAFRELRVEMWKIAADKSISTEDELVKKLFDITGESVLPSRISLNKIGSDGTARNVYEWLKPGQKPSPKSTYIPKGVWSQLQDSGNFFEFTPKTMGELLLPGKIFSPFKKLIEGIFISEGIYSIILFPYKVDGKMESIISFDWCEGSDKVWTHGEIYAGLDLCKILSMNTSKIRSELALQDSEMKLRESEAHFRSLLENSKSFVLFRLRLAPEDKLGVKLMMVSPSIGELFGIKDPYNLNALVKYIHPEDLKMIVEKFFETVPIGQINIEFRFNHPKKGMLWVNGMATAITDEFGNIRYINGILTDNTQKHLAMDELMSHKDHLEELVAIRAKELTKTYEQLNESERKGRFLLSRSVRAWKGIQFFLIIRDRTFQSHMRE